MGILLRWTNLADAAGVNLTVDSEAQGLGLRAILTPQVADVYRSLSWGATTITLRVDLAAIRTINAIALAAPRDGLLPSTGASVRVTADAALPDGNGSLDTVVPGAHNLLLHSAAFTTTWIPNNVTVLPGVGIGPDGTMSATGVSDTTGNTQHWVSACRAASRALPKPCCARLRRSAGLAPLTCKASRKWVRGVCWAAMTCKPSRSRRSRTSAPPGSTETRLQSNKVWRSARSSRPLEGWLVL